jgi:nucleoside-diphosphate-sugar epimerase
MPQCTNRDPADSPDKSISHAGVVESTGLAGDALIIGCGYLGRVLARLLQGHGVRVSGTCRTMERAAELAALGVRPLVVSVTQPVTFAALRPALEAAALDVFYLVPPGRPGASPSPRQVVLGGVAHLVRQLRHARVRRAILTSSTAVYGNTGGERVDADSPAEPHDERGKLLLQGEGLWLDASERHHVVRLAGLYGPGRVIGLRAVRQGAPLVGNPEALLNLIHVDDAAALLLATATSPAAGRVEVGCDGHPVPRIAYYTHLATRLGIPPPSTLDDATAGVTLGLDTARLRLASSKALDNILTCRRTGWTPRYGNYRAGLDACL